MTAPSENVSPPQERSAFEEERRLLLDEVAESLRSVVKRMARANQNLTKTRGGINEVDQVQLLWKESYRRQQEASDAEAANIAAPAPQATSRVVPEPSSSLFLQRELDIDN